MADNTSRLHDALQSSFITKFTPSGFPLHSTTDYAVLIDCRGPDDLEVIHDAIARIALDLPPKV